MINIHSWRLIGEYYLQKAWRILVSTILLAIIFLTIGSIDASLTKGTISDYVVMTLGNQVVTCFGIPLMLVAIHYDLFSWFVTNFGTYIKLRCLSYSEIVKVMIKIVCISSTYVAVSSLFLSISSGLYRGLPISFQFTSFIALHEGFIAIPNRIIMLFVYSITFGMITLIFGMLFESNFATAGIDMILWAIMWIGFQSPPPLVRSYPVYPGSSLYWGNYIESNIPEWIGISNVLWMGISVLIVLHLSLHPRRIYK